VDRDRGAAMPLIDRHLRRVAALWPKVRPLLSSTAVMFVSNGLLKASSAVLFIAVVHRLGKESAGYYSTATTLTAIALNVALFGLDDVLIREVVNRREIARTFVNLLVARIALTFLFTAVLNALLSVFRPYSPDLAFLIGLLSLGQIGEGVLILCQALFSARYQMGLVFLIAASISGLRIVMGLWTTAAGGNLAQLVLMLSTTGTVGAALATWLGGRKILMLSPCDLVGLVDLRYITHHLRRSGSFFGISLFVMIR
jgi:O-antigen/teichoic acid export membrane protein